MAVSHAGMTCHRHAPAVGSECLQDCCRHGAPQGVIQATSGTKPKAGGTQILMEAVPALTHLDMAFAVPPLESIVAASPPRHILLQVFRI
jgi:hypothetical protein